MRTIPIQPEHKEQFWALYKAFLNAAEIGTEQESADTATAIGAQLLAWYPEIEGTRTLINDQIPAIDIFETKDEWLLAIAKAAENRDDGKPLIVVPAKENLSEYRVV